MKKLHDIEAIKVIKVFELYSKGYTTESIARKMGLELFEVEKTLEMKLSYTYILLEKLTPQGSEFFQNPKRCFDYIKDELQRKNELIKKLAKRNNSQQKA